MRIKEFITTIPVNKVSLRQILAFEKTPLNLLLAAVIVIFLGLFAIGIGTYLVHGHHAYNVTREHPWGLLIAVYIFLLLVQQDFV